eukprot:COSAG04_NODE_9150_length_893_cov_1.852645_1_plen_71_part_10
MIISLFSFRSPFPCDTDSFFARLEKSSELTKSCACLQVLDGSVEWTVIAALGIPINLLSALIVCGTGVHVG